MEPLTWIDSFSLVIETTVETLNLMMLLGNSISIKQQVVGGVCLYVNELWCKCVTLKDSFNDVELLTRTRPLAGSV